MEVVLYVSTVETVSVEPSVLSLVLVEPVVYETVSLNIDIVPTLQVIELEVSPQVIDLSLTLETGQFNATWEKLRSEIGQVYNLPPPSGQTIGLYFGDDAYIENNYLEAIRATKPLGVENSLLEHNVLKYSNIFGGYDRHTDELGGTDFYQNFSMEWAMFSFNTDDHDNTFAETSRLADWLGELDVMKIRPYLGGDKHYTFRRWSLENNSFLYRAYGRVYIPSSNTNANSLGIARPEGYRAIPMEVITPTLDQWVDFDIDISYSNSWSGEVVELHILKDGSGFSGLNDPNDDVIYIQDLHFRRVGHNNSTDGYLLDHHTGLGWGQIRKPLEGYVGDAGIAAVLQRLTGTDFGGDNDLYGYTDWFVPNINILYETKNKFYNTTYYLPFRWNSNGQGIASSTNRDTTSLNYINKVDFRNTVLHTPVGSSFFWYVCRKHFEYN